MCKECGYESITYEILTGLSLELPSNKVCENAAANSEIAINLKIERTDSAKRPKLDLLHGGVGLFSRVIPEQKLLRVAKHLKLFPLPSKAKITQSKMEAHRDDIDIVKLPQQTFSTEDLSNTDGLYHCSECNKHVPATRRKSLKFAPQTLILHLKRFTYDGLNKCLS